MPKSPNMSRLEFVTITVGTLGAVIAVTVGIPSIPYLLGPALKTQKTDAWIPLGPVEGFPVGVPTLVSFTRTKQNGWEKTVNSFGVYVVKPETGDIYAMSNVCTHLSCRVTWREGEQDFLCPCHTGLFDIEGLVVDGPPPRPMDRYETKVEEGNLFIRLQEG